MRLLNIKATPHPSGNRIDLGWECPEPAGDLAVRVVRRTDRYPAAPDDGILVAEAAHAVVDTGLRAETVYYYTLFPVTGRAPLSYDGDSATYNRAAAMASGPYNMAGQLYELLPAIYRRYDATSDGQPGPLRRFLELPGGQLDQLYSFSRALLNLYDLDRTDARLLPLLADGIGWRTDFRRDLQIQRNELRYAPYIQETVGSIPTVEATVKRLIGWECRAKEFANNILLSNQPERLNLWATQRTTDGWDTPAAPLSLDFAYEGRPASVSYAEPGGVTRRWLFYHTPRATGAGPATAGAPASYLPPMGSSTICYKTDLSFRLSAAGHTRDLEQGRLSSTLLRSFADHGLALSLDLTLDAQQPGPPHVWRIGDRQSRASYTVREADDELIISTEWSAVQPLRPPGQGELDRHPSAAIFAGSLRVFWDVYDEATRRWRIECRAAGGGTWEQPADAPRAPWAGPNRRAPCAVAHAGALWLFWREPDDAGWRLHASRFDGRSWETPAPLDPRVEDDLFALSDGQQLWLFWARHERVTDGADARIAWRIAYQSYAQAAWGAAQSLAAPYAADEREPAALVGPQGQIELFWSSTRDGSWSLWHGDLANLAGTTQQITRGPFSERAPLPLTDGEGTLLVYRSSASVAYTSPTYSATHTLDTRYAGCTTLGAQTAARSGLWRKFSDFGAYTYDTGPRGVPDNSTWYARDTVGIYLRAETDDSAEIETNRQRIERFLREFLPIQVRLVFIIETPTSTEVLYPADRPLGEEVWAELQSRADEQLGATGESYADRMAGWEWLRAWAAQAPLDVTNNPRYRTRHSDVEAEE